MSIPSVQLPNGNSIPILGLGTSQVLDPSDLEAAVDKALELGYRHFDTAYLYKNEEILGRVFKRWLDSGRIKREELFVVTKLPWIGMNTKGVEHFLRLSLNALQLSYVDLYLIHWPMAMQYLDDKTFIPIKDGAVLLDHNSNLEEVWRAMEKQMDEGLTKNIGISNFNIGQIERILDVARIKPVNLQVEMHVFFQQNELRKYCKETNITMTAYSPLGSPGRANHKFFKGNFVPPPILTEPTVIDIANRHGKSPAAVLLRFLTQQGIIVIPKSQNPKRLQDNFESITFDLTADDIKRLMNLDKGESGRAFGCFPGTERHKDCPFKSRGYLV